MITSKLHKPITLAYLARMGMGVVVRAGGVRGGATATKVTVSDPVTTSLAWNFFKRNVCVADAAACEKR